MESAGKERALRATAAHPPELIIPLLHWLTPSRPYPTPETSSSISSSRSSFLSCQCHLGRPSREGSGGTRSTLPSACVGGGASLLGVWRLSLKESYEGGGRQGGVSDLGQAGGRAAEPGELLRSSVNVTAGQRQRRRCVRARAGGESPEETKAVPP